MQELADSDLKVETYGLIDISGTINPHIQKIEKKYSKYLGYAGVTLVLHRETFLQHMAESVFCPRRGSLFTLTVTSKSKSTSPGSEKHVMPHKEDYY